MTVLTKKGHIAGAKKAAAHVCRVHAALADFLCAGKTLPEVDAFVGRTLDELDSKSCFLWYRIPGQHPFPSHSCLSLNDCVVHGTHLDVTRPLEEGDVLSIETFGASGPAKLVMANYGFTVENVVDKAAQLLSPKPKKSKK